VSEDRFRRGLQGVVAIAIEDQLTNDQLIDGLLYHLAWIAVGGLPEREPLIELVEIIRHKLDVSVAAARKEMQHAQQVSSRRPPERGGAAPDHLG
jgi:hypothetical protein